MQTVVLKTFDDYFSANILLTRLQHEGIPCYLFDEHTVTVNPIFGAVIGGIKLVVSKGYEEAAKRLINRFEEEYQQQVLCPKCSQHKFNLVARQSPENIFTAILTWLFGNYAVAQKIYKCQNCGYETETLPSKESVYN